MLFDGLCYLIKKSEFVADLKCGGSCCKQNNALWNGMEWKKMPKK